MKAYLKHYRQSPRKVRLVADAIRGKRVDEAQNMLTFLDNKSAPALKKLLDSAIANAKNSGAATENLLVKEIMVDQGLTMKRVMPMARGRANQYRKRTSRVALTLGEGVEAKKETPKKKAAKPATVKKTPAKTTKKKAPAKKAEK